MILRGVILVAFLFGASEALYLTPAATSITKSVGESVLFTCTNNDPSSQDIPTWQDTDGYPIRTIDNGGSQDMHVVVYPADKRSQLNIFNIIQNYEGSYGCVLGQDSDSRRLIVFEELEFPNKCPRGPNDPPCDKTHQDNQDIIIHEADRLECTVIGKPEPTIGWNFKGNPISELDERYTFQRTVQGEEITHILAIGNVTRYDEGLYKCQASQLEQAVIKSLDITVDVQEPPKIILPPQDKNGTEHGSITFYCRAEGDPQPEYTWYRGGGDPLQDGEKYTLGDEGRELTIKDLVKNDLGDYTCQAENAAGIDQKAGFLNVFIPPLLNPAFNQTKSLNEQVELECFLRRGEEDTWLRWRRGEKWLRDGKQEFNERWEVFSRVEQGSTVKVLRITDITKEDEGPYTCWAENAGGEDEEDHWLLVEYAPVIDLNRSPHEVKGWVDNESNMTCHWDAFPDAKVRWSRNQIPLKDGVNATIETEEVIGGVITILYVTPTSRDFGPYECHAENRLGKATHNINFKQVFPPEPLTNIRVTDISSTTFTIEVEDPDDNGGLRIEGYQVGYHLPGYPEDYQDFNETEPIKVLGLTPDRKYFYRVAAVNDVGVGEFSDNKTVTTEYYSPPDAPIILSKKDDGRGDKYTLEWREADNNGGGPVQKFEIRWSLVSNKDETELGPDPQDIEVDRNAIAYTITNLEPGKYYWIEIYARNAFGLSKSDGINIVMPGGVPLIPTTKYPETPGTETPGTTDESHPQVNVTRDPNSNKLPQISGDLSTAALIGIILGAFFVLLIVVDISCYFMNSCGFMMCICVHCCGKVPPDEKDDLELGDGPPGYGNKLDRGNGEVPDTVMPLKSYSDDDDDSIVKPPVNGFSEGSEEHLPGYRRYPEKRGLREAPSDIMHHHSFIEVNQVTRKE
ncbi:neural cell adhesion molecule 2-like isoform X3 [Amphiura filiformis]|uniref:neural cell adhesion molecule 2-like isoform X3 n=1 Tax=Amphiura filiformis TaxID=82378 RepID=UPI003B22195C